MSTASPGFTALRALVCSLALTALVASTAYAGPTDPITVSPPPTGVGDAFVPGFRTLDDLAKDYVEEEFFISGTATLYSYAHNPPLGPTDITEIQTGIPYETRIIVRRPASHGPFKGTVVIEWWNSTAGFDTAPVWDPSAEYFGREGIIYVGFTNSTTSMGFLTGGCSLFGVLPPTCGTRYASLSLPENGLAWDIASQLANLLKSDDPANPIPPEYDVERIYHAGQSQQGGSTITYASGFHTPGLNDGYFVQGATGARSINFGPACGSEGAPPFPDCTPRLEGADRLVRTDLPVPVVQAQSETDVFLSGGSGRQADTPTYRYYETAGTSHLSVHKDIAVVGNLFLEDLCQNELNTIADGPVFGSYLLNAMWDNLDAQVQNGDVPPAGDLIETDGTGQIARDEHGNALGGIRLPEMDFPTGSHNPPTNQADPNLPAFLQQIGNLACFLGGSTFPFDQATLDDLYPNKGQYVSEVVRAANELRDEGFLLSKDRQLIVSRAVGRMFCGIGFELVFVLPPLMWLRRRMR